MSSLRRMLLLFTAACALGAVGKEAAGPAATPTGVPVTVDLASGPTATGTYAMPSSIKLKTDYGAIDVDVSKIKTLDVDPDAPSVVTLLDKNRVYGRLLTESFPIDPPVEAKDVRTIKFQHPADTSWTAALVGLVTLTLMEIILGVDNIIFLAILAAKLPEPQRPTARRIGLIAALGTRLLLLATLSVLIGLTKPLFYLPAGLPLLDTTEARGVSWRDLILLAGGLFLIGKSVFEMHEKLEAAKGHDEGKPAKVASFASVIVQIAIIDIVFSLDSVITAVGMVEQLWVMIVAMLLAVGVMIVAAEPISRFVERRPTIKVLALSFLILIGVLLVAEGLGQHIDKGYIYFAMAFAVGVELVNVQLRPTAPAVAAATAEAPKG